MGCFVQLSSSLLVAPIDQGLNPGEGKIICEQVFGFVSIDMNADSNFRHRIRSQDSNQ